MSNLYIANTGLKRFVEELKYDCYYQLEHSTGSSPRETIPSIKKERGMIEI